MTKADFISGVAGAIGLTKKQVEEVIDVAFGDLRAAVIQDGVFTYPGLGTFKATARAARTGRNPKTGETLKIPASKSVKFKPAPSFKDSL